MLSGYPPIVHILAIVLVCADLLMLVGALYVAGVAVRYRRELASFFHWLRTMHDYEKVSE